jgi:hypothetical protein
MNQNQFQDLRRRFILLSSEFYHCVVNNWAPIFIKNMLPPTSGFKSLLLWKSSWYIQSKRRYPPTYQCWSHFYPEYGAMSSSQSLVSTYQCWSDDDGHSMFLRNVGNHIPDYTVWTFGRSNRLHGAQASLRRHRLVRYSTISHHFMEPEVSLSCSQELANDPSPEPDESSPRYSIPFL